MLILAIESSCDETAAAVSLDGRKILSDVVYSQADMHAEFGGVVPEIASRKHIEKISLVAQKVLSDAHIGAKDLDAVAATCAPGLIGALLVGANFAKGAALALGKPFIPVHHIRGHIAANYTAFPELEPPFCAMVASGGHTVIIDVRDYTEMTVLGTTRDDAAGEAFDKTARILGLPYPGGAAIDKLSKQGDAKKIKLPRSVIPDNPYDFSFSGLKTAALNYIHNARQKGETVNAADVAAAVSEAVADSISPRVIAAALECGRERVVAAGKGIFDGEPFAILNQDGVDLRKGCHHIDIENLSGHSGDDTVALTAIPPKELRPGGRLGSTEVSGFDGDLDAAAVHHVNIRKIHSYAAGGHQIVRLLNTGGVKLHDVLIEDVLDTSEGSGVIDAATIRIGDCNPAWGGVTPLGDTFNVTVRKVDSRSRYAVLIAGSLADSVIEEIIDRNGENPPVVCSSGEDHLRNVSVKV